MITLSFVVLAFTAECKEGIRNDPVLIIRDNKNHYVYFLPDEMDICNQYKNLFTAKTVKRVCGCKILKDESEDDRLRLRCAELVKDKMHSYTIMMFYYYPESTQACIQARDHLIFKAK